jgi:lambda family phage portal protein
VKPARKTFRAAGRAWAKAIKGMGRGLYDAVASTASAFGWPGGGGYQVLDPNRKVINGLTKMLARYSANELGSLSLPNMRSLCRNLERNNATARAAVEGSTADVVGTGIALEPDHGDDGVNARIRPFWNDYIRGCDITGTRSIYDLEAEAFRSWYISGEHLWRTPVLPELIELGRIPLVVLPLDSEWIVTDLPDIREEKITRVAGMELDRWGRPVAFWLRNPEAGLDGKAERVPASEMIHGFEHRRPLQNRGEPWLSPVIERIAQEGDLIDTELKAAINCSGIAVVVTSDFHPAMDDGTGTTQNTDGTENDPAQGIGIGSIARVNPGDKVEAFMHNRPGQQIAAFTRMLRCSIAAACRVAVRWLDRDPERSNYSSMRADQQDSQRLLAPVREIFGHATIGALYLKVLPYLCAKAGIAVPARKAYKLLPDEQPYVNPKDDLEAMDLAVSKGFSTYERECAKRGLDYREVWAQRKMEQEEAKKLGLSLTAPAPSPASEAGKRAKHDFATRSGFVEIAAWSFAPASSAERRPHTCGDSMPTRSLCAPSKRTARRARS